MKDYPQGIRPWARRVPLWALPTVGRVFVAVLLPAFVVQGAWRSIREWWREVRDPF